jgi:tetratricopeptide (TPR) repeat protein
MKIFDTGYRMPDPRFHSLKAKSIIKNPGSIISGIRYRASGIIFFTAFLFIVLIPSFTIAQDVDIVSYLKQIESGEKDEVEKELPDLKKKYPNSPSIMFLDGVLTQNGQDAISIYNRILDTYPFSKYADASLFRIYSYYYALGLYETAKNHLNRLKKDYPDSPYINIAERNTPSDDEVPVDTKKTTEPLKTNYLYTIQAGAFSQLLNAQTLKEDFENSGFKSQVKDKTVGGTTFHVVYVGEFASEDEAKNFLQVINKEFKLEGRVVDIENEK